MASLKSLSFACAHSDHSIPVLLVSISLCLSFSRHSLPSGRENSNNNNSNNNNRLNKTAPALFLLASPIPTAIATMTLHRALRNSMASTGYICTASGANLKCRWDNQLIFLLLLLHCLSTDTVRWLTHIKSSPLPQYDLPSLLTVHVWLVLTVLFFFCASLLPKEPEAMR